MHKLFLIFAFFLTLFSFSADSAFAQQDAGGGNFQQIIKQFCSPTSGATATSNHLVVTQRVVTCFEELMRGVAKKYATGLGKDLRKISTTLLVLYLIFYGVKVATGMGESAKKEAFIHLLKIAFITALVIKSDMLVLQFIDIIENVQRSMIDIVLSTLAGDLSSLGDGCSTEDLQSGNNKAVIWRAVDCIFQTFIGWGQQYGAAVAGSAVLFSLPVGLLFGGIIAVSVIVVIITTVITIFSAFFRIVQVYLLSIMALTLLMGISPLIIPLYLFNQTRKFFDAWLKQIIAYFLQPVILFAFISVLFTTLIPTLESITNIFKQIKPAYANIGENSPIDALKEAALWFDSKLKTGELLTLFFDNLTVIVTIYLLISFTDFIFSLAQELVGSANVGSFGTASGSLLPGSFAGIPVGNAFAGLGGGIRNSANVGANSIFGKGITGLGRR